MQYLDIRETKKDWHNLYRDFLNNKFFPLTIRTRTWSTQQQLDYLESLYHGNPTKYWFVQQTKIGHWVLKYGHEQFYTLLDFQMGMIKHRNSWEVGVSHQDIIIKVIRPSVSQEDVQEVIRRYLSE